MHIGDLSKKAGIAASAIRYYESAGVLPRPARKSGRRVYDHDALVRLNLIALAQAAGFTLKETAELFRAFDRTGWRSADFASFAARKMIEIDAQLDRLNSVRDLLEKSAACNCLGLKDCAIYDEARRHKPTKASRPIAR